MGMYDAIQHDG